MKNVKKILVLALAALLLVAVGVGGTLAWLTATSNEVQNTFTATSLGVQLNETNPDGKTSWSQPLLPGQMYDKDPKVTLTAGGADAWVFVEIIETNNDLANGGGKKVTCNIDTTNWVQVMDGTTAVTTDEDGSVGIWMYKTNVLTASDTTGVYFLEKGTDQHGSVTVNTAVTTADMGENNLPSITFKAYALQSANLEIDGKTITNQNAASNAYAMWQLVAPVPASSGT